MEDSEDSNLPQPSNGGSVLPKRRGPGLEEQNGKKQRTAAPLVQSEPNDPRGWIKQRKCIETEEWEERRKSKSFQATRGFARTDGLIIASLRGQAKDGCFFSCVFHQLQTLSLEEDLQTKGISSALDLKQKCADYLAKNSDISAVSPRMENSATAPPNQRPLKHSGCTLRSIESYADALRQGQPPIRIAGILAACNVLNCQISILQQVHGGKSTAVWEIWDPFGDAPVRGILKLAKVTKKPIFESLIEGEDNSDEDYEEGEGDSQLGDGDARAKGDSAFSLRLCSNPQCRKRRWVLPSAAPASLEDWRCSNNTRGMVEASCADAPIWNEIVDFCAGQKNLGREFLGVPLDFSLFFIAVQQFNTATDPHRANGLEMVVQELRLSKKLAKLLAPNTLKRLDQSSTRIKNLYRDVFQEHSNLHGGRLEKILLSSEHVRETIKRHRQEIFRLMGVDEVKLNKSVTFAEASLNSELQAALESRPVYQKSLAQEHSAETVRQLLEKFLAAMAPSLAPQHRDAPWYDWLDPIAERIREYLGGDSEMQALVFFGDTNVGKSRMLDLLLQVSECYKNDYDKAQPPRECLEAAVYLSSLPASSAAGPWSKAVFVVDAPQLHASVTREILDCEERSLAMLCRRCVDSQDSTSAAGLIRPYVLPLGRDATSTTACIISVRRGNTFQAVLEYRSRAQVLQRWAQWKAYRCEQEAAEDDDRVDEVQMLEARMTAIETEVRRAFGDEEIAARVGGTGVEAWVKQFLAGFDEHASDLSGAPELLQVLGQSFACCGAGLQHHKDRIFVRRAVHYAQAIPDVDHVDGAAPGQEQEQEDGALPEAGAGGRGARGAASQPPFLSFGNDAECLRFGQRTHFALKQITVICPCRIAPACKSAGQRGLVDSCGCNDQDPLKKEAFLDAAKMAAAALVVVERSLTSATTVDGLKCTAAMKSLVRDQVLRTAAGEAGGQLAPGAASTGSAVRTAPSRVFVAVNYEVQHWRSRNLPVTTDHLTSKHMRDTKIDSLRTTKDGMSTAAKTTARELSRSAATRIDAVQVAQAVKDGTCHATGTTGPGALVPVAWPCFFLFASLVLNADYDALRYQDRVNALEGTECYSMLGFIEAFLRTTSHKKLQALIACVEQQRGDLQASISELQHSQNDRQKQSCIVSKEKPQEYERWEAGFGELENNLRRSWVEFVDSFAQEWKWPEGMDEADEEKTNEMKKSLTSFLRDCKQVKFDPFKEVGLGKEFVPLARGDQSSAQGTRTLSRVLQVWWDHAIEHFQSEFESAICQNPSRAEAEGGSTFFHVVLKLIVDFSIPRAEAYAARFAAQLGQAPRASILKFIDKKVSARLAAFARDVGGHSLSSYTLDFDAALKALLHTLNLAAPDDRASLLINSRGEIQSALRAFFERVRAGIVARVKALVPAQSARARRGPGAKTRASLRGKSKRERVTRQLGAGSHREAVDASVAVGEKFLHTLGFTTEWSSVAEGPGSQSDVLRKICCNMVDLVDPNALLSKAGEDLARMKVMELQMGSFLEGMRDAKSEWDREKMDPGSQDLASVGRRLAKTWMNDRLAEQLDHEAKAGGSFPARFNDMPFTDMIGKLKENEPEGFGFVFFETAKHLPLAKSASGEFNRERRNQLVEEVLENYGLRLTVDCSNDDPPDHLFKLYGDILGMQHASKVVKMQMRNMVRLMAIQEESCDPDSYRQRAITKEFESVNNYIEQLKSGTAPVDLLALSYLVDKSGRPLNLYTPWHRYPLRMVPSSVKGNVLDESHADALMCFGWERYGMGDADGEEEPMSSLESAVSCGTPETGTRWLFAACASVQSARYGAAAGLTDEAWGKGGSGLTATLKNRLEEFGLELEEVDDTGHCQFDAISRQINQLGLVPEFPSYTFRQVRRALAGWLKDNAAYVVEPGSDERGELSRFLRQDDGEDWATFCDNVEDAGRSPAPLWGSHNTLIAAANVYGRPIQLSFESSIAGDTWWTEIVPQGLDPAAEHQPIQIAHLVEKNHYMSVRPRGGVGPTRALPRAECMPLSKFRQLCRQRDDLHSDGAGESAADDASDTSCGTPVESPPESGDHLMVDVVPDSGDAEDDGARYRLQFASFNRSQWKRERKAGEVRWRWDTFSLAEKELASLSREYPQFVECYKFMRGKQADSRPQFGAAKDYSAIHRRLLPCDDAISDSESCVCVFDGVGATGHNGGLWARTLSEKCVDAATEALRAQTASDPKYNRSEAVLHEVFLDACAEYSKRVQDLAPEHRKVQGSTTAVILTLLRQQGSATLHSLVCGDSQWALLRRNQHTHRHETVYLSPPVHETPPKHGPLKGRRDIPLQILPRRQSISRVGREKPTAHEVKHGDIVVAATDGFFDNFRDDQGTPEQVKRKLEEHCQGNADNVERLGRALADVAVRRMPTRTGKPDDISLFVGKIFMGEASVGVRSVPNKAEGNVGSEAGWSCLVSRGLPA